MLDEKMISSASGWPEGMALLEEPKLSDLGNAQRLIARHGNKLRYCHPWGRWLVYDGRRWQTDETREVVRCGIDTVKALASDALELADDKRREKTVIHALKSEGDSRIRAMLSLARSLEGIPVLPNELDADPWALNLMNGTLDLRTLELRQHRPGDLITKLAPVEYDAAAAAPRWSAFLERTFAGDVELGRFVQRLVGYSLTGATGAQLLPICFGHGANGKSTFLETIRRIAGDYGHQAPSELLMHRDRSRGGATPDLADLQGRRFVAAVETGDGRRLDEPLVKQLTGGDAINARRLYGQPFTFTPAHTIWLATNHRPEIRGSDLAIWRRVHLIPFGASIPSAEQDPHLLEKLLDESAGILAWALDGCRRWQKGGLGAPAAVTAATAEYRDAMDVLGAFIADCCVEQEQARTKAGDLYNRFGYWADANGEHDKPSQKAFGMRLRERGFSDSRGAKGVRYWNGISLLEGDG
jgi:putative DNA primase/helicase